MGLVQSNESFSSLRKGVATLVGLSCTKIFVEAKSSGFTYLWCKTWVKKEALVYTCPIKCCYSSCSVAIKVLVGVAVKFRHFGVICKTQKVDLNSEKYSIKWPDKGQVNWNCWLNTWKYGIKFADTVSVKLEKFMIWTQELHTWMEFNHLDEMSPEKDCWCWLTFLLPEWKSSSDWQFEWR